MSSGMVILGFLVGVLILLSLITVHELGHFIVAKMANAFVYEFSIGFGPRIWVWKRKETWISIRMIPLGGFCSIASSKVDPPTERENEIVPEERMIDYIARWKRLFFIAFGPLMNLFVALFLFTTIFAATQSKPNDLYAYGAKFAQNSVAQQMIWEREKQDNPEMPLVNIDQTYAIWGWKLISTDQNQETTVLFNNLCTESGTDCGTNEVINSFESKQAVTYYKTVYNFINNLQLGKDKENVSIQFAYKQIDRVNGSAIGQYKVTQATTSEQYTGGGSVGIAAPNRYYKNAGVAYGAGWKETFTQSFSILKSFGRIFTGGIKDLAGPVGIANQTAAMFTSAQQFFLYVALLSANLFVLNFILIPPLDGYKILETIIEMIIRKELPEKYKLVVYSIGAILFLGLFVVITVLDLVL
ncbi:regulator of sigma E protease [Spiroplasma chinense]|uniref:Regulator of sigma E protease n=1 Tax=Spiroplasma chinense TaxID=216932 RepID=A0A5B9Y4Q1_9MOLU|nr:site-2 protease family protein [Spiroplasma chinense]QEH62064.1 regulator of sigma E protease [Spiroplasma chinense]